MKKLNVLAIMAILFAAVFTSCSSDDGERPSVEVMEPHDNSVVSKGGKILLKAMLADEIELSSYKVDIHYAGDGHTHKDGDASGVEWDFEMTQEISGTTHEIDMEIDVPLSIMHQGKEETVKEGEYHLGVFVINGSGRDNRTFVDIEITAPQS